MDSKQDSLRIVNSYGKRIAEKVKYNLLKDPKLSPIKQELEYIAGNWNDPLTPALIQLSCKAVNKGIKANEDICLALGLINLTINLWDNILDDHTTKLFRDTFYGRFGKDKSLIIGGLALAKANEILIQSKVSRSKKRAISTDILEMWNKLAIAEINDLEMANQSSLEKFSKIANESIYVETLMQIGVTLGGGTKQESQALRKYGRHLGIILETSKDLELSLNLTAQLPEKLSTRKLPFTLLWASENSETEILLNQLLKKESTKPEDIERLVLAVIKAGTIEYVYSLIESSTKAAISALDVITETKHKFDLKKFVGAQLQLLKDKLAVN